MHQPHWDLGGDGKSCSSSGAVGELPPQPLTSVDGVLLVALSRMNVQEVLAGGGSGWLWWLLTPFWALCLDCKAAK